MKEIKGNLLDFPEGITAIVQGCNTLARMKSGLAKAISERYPQAVLADEEYHNRQKGMSGLILGKVSFCEIPDKGRIYNLYQQSTIRTFNPEKKRHINYEAFYLGLQRIKTLESLKPNAVIGFPKGIGCGLAGGDWAIVKAMITSVFAYDQVVIVELAQ